MVLQGTANSHGDTAGLRTRKLGYGCGQIMNMDCLPTNNGPTHRSARNYGIRSLFQDRH